MKIIEKNILNYIILNVMSSEIEIINNPNYQVYKTQIENVIAWKNYLDNMIQDFKADKIGPDVIMKLSAESENFFQKMENGNETKFNPKIVEMISESSDSESDSELSTNALSDSESDDETYKNKMQQYFKHTVYDDEPEFIDAEEETHYSIGTKINRQSEIYNTPTPNNTPLNKSLLEQYNQFQQTRLQGQQIPGHPTGYSLSTGLPKSEHLMADDAYGYLERFMKQNESQQTQLTGRHLSYGTNNPGLPDDIPRKPKDKLVDEFLNNNLELNKYHYLKSFSVDRVNNFMESCLSY